MLVANIKRTHGWFGTTEYRIWQLMKDRCHNPKSPAYHWYGARGIAVCDEWRASFESFLKDMGPRPSGKVSLDRVDNDAGYGPSNCRWADSRTQARNSRKVRLLTHDGVTLPLVEWSKRTGIKATTIAMRIDSRHWSVDDALSQPVRLKSA